MRIFRNMYEKSKRMSDEIKNLKLAGNKNEADKLIIKANEYLNEVIYRELNLE
jgi:hypothetical protein